MQRIIDNDGCCSEWKNNRESWLKFIRHVEDRGLKGVPLMIGDKCLVLVEVMHEVYPETQYKGCMVNYIRNIQIKVPESKGKEVCAK